MTFLRFRSSFLSDLFCSHSEVKLVANINWLQHSKNKVLMVQLELLGVTVREVNDSNPGRERKINLGYSLACRSRAILPLFVGLCSN